MSKNEGLNIAYARVTKDTTNNDILGSTASSYGGVEIFWKWYNIAVQSLTFVVALNSVPL